MSSVGARIEVQGESVPSVAVNLTLIAAGLMAGGFFTAVALNLAAGVTMTLLAAALALASAAPEDVVITTMTVPTLRRRAAELTPAEAAWLLRDRIRYGSGIGDADWRSAAASRDRFDWIGSEHTARVQEALVTGLIRAGVKEETLERFLGDFICYPGPIREVIEVARRSREEYVEILQLARIIAHADRRPMWEISPIGRNREATCRILLPLAHAGSPERVELTAWVVSLTVRDAGESQDGLLGRIHLLGDQQVEAGNRLKEQWSEGPEELLELLQGL